ncbi:Complex I intermediate-associated protein 30, mitochondrial [Psilocybe cubensis]|uniref:Complex I intermediate-associated protein 30, mitochondrial n=2 Tax=Psilocybe cubensis TaxID=181762 RepID=A0ACB8H175_PSICU|nr:Complex I intermediate-associated protein 30, mitochondrial [Psilocybe cubensis]KAH9481658.1 Complex I intermediate-associated protein 30, mitochondrial [Psilocybe cubensis]
MKGADAPARGPKTVFTFNTAEDIQGFATGCDGDIGGLSTVALELDERPEVNEPIGKTATGVFRGEMRLSVKPGMETKIRGGYAGFRNKNRPAFLYGNLTEDASLFDYLALRVRLAGEPQTHSSYFVNIQTAGPVSTDLWQHRLYLRKHNTWEDVFVPFDNFVRTNAGEMSKKQITMYREKIKSIGISILGGNSGIEGKYELGIDSFRFVNEEDVVGTSLTTPLTPQLVFLVVLM